MNSTATLRVAPACALFSEGVSQSKGFSSKFGKACWLVALLLLSLHAGSYAQGMAAARRSLAHTATLPKQMIALAQPAPPSAPSSTPALVSLMAIRGQVIDEDGEPLVGATIMVKGSQLATATDADGYYSLAVVAGDYTICYGSAGYYNEEVTVRTATADLTVTLKYRPNAFKRIKRK